MKIGKLLDFLKNEFVYGGHLLSLGAVGIVITAALILDIGITWDFMLITYSLIYIAYSYNRLIEFRSDYLTNPLRTQHLERSIRFLPFVIILASSIVVFLTAKFGNVRSIFLVVLLVIGSLLYSVCLKGLTRNIVGFKSFYVSFFWAFLIALLASYYYRPLSAAVLIIFLFVFLRLVVNTVFFDIKDIDSDGRRGLKTLPVYLGKTRVIALIHVLNLASFAPLLVGVFFNVIPSVSMSLLLFIFYSYYYLDLVKNSNVNIQKLSYLMVDGEYILWPVAVIILKSLTI